MEFEKYQGRIASIPALRRFCEQAADVVREDDPETFWRAEPLLRELLDSNIVESFMHYGLTAVANENHHFLVDSSEVHAPVVESSTYCLLIKVFSPESQKLAPLSSLTEHHLIGTWSGGDTVTVDTYALEEPFQNEVFDRSKTLVRLAPREIAPGVIARFRAGSEVLRLRLERPVVMVLLRSPILVPLRWIFNSETLAPQRAVASRLSSSRLQFTCHTLATLGSPTSLDALKRLTKHPEHYVRWAAVQSICQISREDGLECVRRALDDDHPHIRRAAEKTLAAECPQGV